MKYDFTTEINRHGKDAMAVDGLGLIPGKAPNPPKEGFDVIPMWIADMNFATVPTVIQAMTERLEHPIFGYFMQPKEYYNAIIHWHQFHHQVEGLTAKHIGYHNSVLGGVVSALTSFATPGDSILVHSPTYGGFTEVLKNNGVNIVLSPLVKDGEGVYRIDYKDMEEKIRKNHIHVSVFCSPHNPTGRVWNREELEKVMTIYQKYDVTVISDEIWSDLVMPGVKHIPTQSVSEDAKNRTIAFYAPSKTFNLAGLVAAYHIIYSDLLRDRVNAKGSKSHYNVMNVLSMHALMGAYQPEGYEWLEELRQVLYQNMTYVCDFIRDHFEGVSVTNTEGPYVIFIDCMEYLEKNDITIDELQKRGSDVGVAWQDGRIFNGPTHIRLNVALPFTRIQEACERMKKYVFI